MHTPKLTLLIVALAVLVGAFFLAPRTADGDAKSELADAVKKGKALWVKQWRPGAKTCAACHDKPGPNRMVAKRLNAWPKYDKFLKKVATGQEKINQMIVKMSKGKALELGSADLTALEAYIKSR